MCDAVRIGLEQEDKRRRAVVDMEEFAPRRAGPPDDEARVAALLRLVGPPDQRRQDVARLKIEIVARAVEVGRHRGNEVGAMLVAIGLAELDAGDLGDRIGLVGRLEGAGQQALLDDRLVGEFRIDAARAEEQELLDADREGRMDDVRLDHQVVVEEVRRVGGVGEDAADLRRGKDDGVGPGLGEPGLDLGLAAEIDRLPVGGEDLAGLGFEAADDRLADHAAMAGDPDPLAVEGIDGGGIRHRGSPSIPPSP